MSAADKPAWTPGEWAIGSSYGDLKTEIVCDDGHKAIAAVWTKRPELNRTTGRSEPVDDAEGLANANLIAAAPALYEALDAYDTAFIDFDPADQKSRMAMRLVIIKARAALALARGERA